MRAPLQCIRSVDRGIHVLLLLVTRMKSRMTRYKIALTHHRQKSAMFVLVLEGTAHGLGVVFAQHAATSDCSHSSLRSTSICSILEDRHDRLEFKLKSGQGLQRLFSKTAATRNRLRQGTKNGSRYRLNQATVCSHWVPTFKNGASSTHYIRCSAAQYQQGIQKPCCTR